jgi:heterodisulfide reductase subunit C
MKRQIKVSQQNNELLKEIEALTGTPVGACSQCGKCSGGCPVTAEHDGGPREVIRLIQLGHREDVYPLSAAWRCVGCMTCGTRCPFGIEVPKVMDAVRQLGLRDGVKMNEGSMKMHCFVVAFLDAVRDYGRLYEPTMMVQYNLNSGYMVTNFHKAIGFLSRRKLTAWPERVKNIGRLRRVFDRIAEEEEWPQ